MFTINRRFIVIVVVLGACLFAGEGCSSSQSPGGGNGGATAAGSGGSPAGTGGNKADSGFETDAAAILPAPVLDPTGTYGGKTYAEWGAAWEKWQLELPGPDFPEKDSTGVSCAVGQSGATDGGGTQTSVFFLSDSSIGTVSRSCMIPSGEMTFVPLMGFFWDNGGVPDGGVPVGGQLTDEQIKSNLTVVASTVAALSLEIDGKSYGSTVSDFAAYLSGPTQFSYTIPDTPTNVSAAFPAYFGGAFFSGLVPKSFCTGYWILLAPLSVGPHNIHFTMHRNAVPSLGVGAYDQDITYNLTVE